jgi:hypothetical protein
VEAAMKTAATILVSLAALATGSGCTSYQYIARWGITKISPDVYISYKTDKGGEAASEAAMKAAAIAEANKFAEGEGKMILPITTYWGPVSFAGGFTTCNYEFRLVDANSPALQFNPERAKAFRNGNVAGS